MTTPALQAFLDQWAAAARDTYDQMGVDITDPDQARAIRATILMAHHSRYSLAYLIGGITELVGTEWTRPSKRSTALP